MGDAPEFRRRWCHRSPWRVVWSYGTEQLRRINIAPCGCRNCPECSEELANRDAELARDVYASILRDHPGLRLYRLPVDSSMERQREMDAVRKAGHYAWAVPQDGGGAVIYSTYLSRRVKRAGYVETWGEDGTGYSECGIDLRRQVAEDFANWSGNHRGEDQRRSAWNAKAWEIVTRLDPSDRAGRPRPVAVDYIKPSQRPDYTGDDGLTLTGAQVELVHRFELLHDHSGRPWAWRLPTVRDPWEDLFAFASVFGALVPGELREIGQRLDARREPSVVLAA
jgi:hypothetical protein